MNRAYRACSGLGFRAFLFSLPCLVGITPTAHAVKVASITPNGEWIIEESRPSVTRFGGPGAETFTGINLTIHSVYLDCVANNGAGFDDPARGAIRRATVAAVYAYLDTVIGNVGTLDVEFQVSIDLAGATLATAGTHFFLIDGFNPGFTLEHLTSGVDPDPGDDIRVTVDFPTHTWNDDLGAPGGAEIDLFSVLLHELTHGLGWVSLSNSAGASQFPTHPKVFTLYDNFIFTGGTHKDLFILDGVFTGSPSDLLGADGGLVFNGSHAIAAFGSEPPLYSPNTFFPGTSIAHSNLGIPGGSVMEPSISSGVQKRNYTNTDIGILVDLGYTQYVPTPSPTPAPNAASGWEIYL